MGKGCSSGGCRGTYSSLCEIMFPLCNAKECKARAAYIKESDGLSRN